MTPEQKIAVKHATKKLIDEGKIIEGGWVAFKMMTISKLALDQQLDDMRGAFFAGAQHLFGSIMATLDEGQEPTANDLRRVAQIHEELDAFIEDFKEETCEMIITKPQQLKPFSVNPICDKCGGEDISRQYHFSNECSYGCGIFGNWIEFEHHAMYCRTCMFKWQEQIKDAK